MPDFVIETELGCQIVLERIVDLAGCLEGSLEERELIALHLAFEIWETKRWREACSGL